jgi:hypothetical protein
VPDSIKAAIGAERAGFTSRLGESRAQALTELDDRRVQAVEGAGFAKSNALRVLASTLTKLFERGQDLRREKGAFTVATAQQLKTAADRAGGDDREPGGGPQSAGAQFDPVVGDRPGHGEADPGRQAGPEGEDRARQEEADAGGDQPDQRGERRDRPAARGDQDVPGREARRDRGAAARG